MCYCLDALGFLRCTSPIKRWAREPHYFWPCRHMLNPTVTVSRSSLCRLACVSHKTGVLHCGCGYNISYIEQYYRYLANCVSAGVLCWMDWGAFMLPRWECRAMAASSALLRHPESVWTQSFCLKTNYLLPRYNRLPLRGIPSLLVWYLDVTFHKPTPISYCPVQASE